MKAEIKALEDNQTWIMVDLPAGNKPIGCKWVYKVKCKLDGSIDKYKARLVVKRYNQIEGIDYFDSFSPVAKVVTVRVMLAMAAAKGWCLHQLDINNAFHYGYLDGEIYMIPPEGYDKGLPNQQASRQWNHDFTDVIIGLI
ncbi:transmembrane signal receptor [Lithospermum erythrorhizon]|uniref:Transmembrane signal receptor n=1 Tax=Lithospermum erythrorhizon TaxID=34254 RepID=A0AAV3R0X6_LITER